MSTDQERIAEIEARMQEIHEEQKRLGKEWQRLKNRDLNGRLTALFEDGITIAKVMSLDWDEIGNRGYGQKWYKRITDWIETQVYFEMGENEDAPLRGVHYDGLNPNTGQIGLKVMMRQREPLEQQLGFLLVLPHLKAVEGWKSVPIFESSLGASGEFYRLRVSEDHETVEVWNDRDLTYQDDDGARKFHPPMFEASGEGAVESALRFIHERLPYEWGRGEDSEDDEDSW